MIYLAQLYELFALFRCLSQATNRATSKFIKDFSLSTFRPREIQLPLIRFISSLSHHVNLIFMKFIIIITEQIFVMEFHHYPVSNRPLATLCSNKIFMRRINSSRDFLLRWRMPNFQKFQKFNLTIIIFHIHKLFFTHKLFHC